MLKFISRIFLVIVLMCITIHVYPRAGGGGDDFGFGGGILVTILAFILAPFFFIYSLIATLFLGRKNRKAKKLVEELAAKDKIWNMRNMVARVEEVYFKVQKAWSERDQEIARSCMTDRIYNKHKLQTDDMISHHTRNVLERVNLKETSIFSVADYKDNSLDTFSAKIEGSMIDYHVDDRSNNLISGDKLKAGEFKEIWTFVREGNTWMLDEIDQKVTVTDMLAGKAYSES